MAKLTPGQLRVTARRHPRTGEVEFKLAYADDVPEDAANWLYNQLTASRETLLTKLNPANPLEPPFLPAWAERGFNPASIRFSIFTLAARRPQPKRFRIPPQRPGVLYVKWARVEYDPTPDLVTTWQWPCTRRDSRYFHSFLSMPTGGTGYHDHSSIWEELEANGFDRTTFRFEVHHASPWVVDQTGR